MEIRSSSEWRAWWKERTRTHAYQEAYDRIASEIDADKTDFLVDIGCGTGEIIRRIESRRIVGTDNDLRMLFAASKHLRDYRIASEIVTTPLSRDALVEKLGKRKVILCLDNCLDTKLPRNLFNIAINSFSAYDEQTILTRSNGRKSRLGAEDKTSC